MLCHSRYSMYIGTLITLLTTYQLIYISILMLQSRQNPVRSKAVVCAHDSLHRPMS